MVHIRGRKKSRKTVLYKVMGYYGGFSTVAGTEKERKLL